MQSGTAKAKEQSEKNWKSRLRAQAKRQGLIMRKSRAGRSVDNFGGYMLVDANKNYIVSGARFDMSLDDVAGYLKE